MKYKANVHEYEGIEHSQPGPFSECLLCEIERLRAELRRIGEMEWQDDGPMTRHHAIRIAREALGHQSIETTKASYS